MTCDKIIGYVNYSIQNSIVRNNKRQNKYAVI